MDEIRTSTPTLQRLNATAPTPLVHRARKARLVGERKPVTAVFADIVDSTALAESIDPEDWTLIINAAFDEMSRHIFEYEGTIAQIQGDAIISFFGAPVAHEDDPERAVRAALAMAAAMETFEVQIRDEHGIEFKVRFGISTGPVMVGDVGSDLRFDYTAIGDTMNLASRLQGAAPPGGILISDRTERFVGPLFELEDIGELELKGKSAAVRAYRVTGERDEPGSTRGISGLHSPIVGRDRESRTLLEAAAAVRAGVGRAVIVTGEPGMGKSRLVAELRDALKEQDLSSDGPSVAWIGAQASSYGAHEPLRLIRGIVLDIIGAPPAARVEEIDAALAVLLGHIAPGDDDAYAYLAYLLDLPRGGTGPTEVGAVSGEQLEERIVAAVLRLVKRSADQGPIVLHVDDLHWSDASSVGVLEGLLTLVEQVPLLLLLGSREESASAGWGVVRAGRDRFGAALVEIRLQPLDAPDSRALVSNLLEIESLATDTRDLILRKAEGNPLFVEEVIRMLIDQGSIEQRGGRWVAVGEVPATAIPDTVHGLILSRIDHLPVDARRVLRVASCIDRRFSVPLLQDVLSRDDDEESVRSALARLEAANLIQLEATLPELEYRFAHALIQDGAYQTILRQERRQWHQRIGDALLARHPDRETELASQLATHYELAADASRAIRYLVMAARQVMKRNSMMEARQLLDRAAAIEADLPEPDSDESMRLRLALNTSRIPMEFLFLRLDESRELVRSALEMAESLGDESQLVDVLFWDVFIRRVSGERPDTSPPLQAALTRLDEVADAGGDDLQRALVLMQTGVISWATGDFQTSMPALEEATELMAARGDAIGASMAQGYVAANLASMGDFLVAEEHMVASRRLADEADELARLDYQIAEAAVASLKGDYAKSMRYASQCLSSASDLGALGCATVAGIVLGASQIGAGQPGHAETTLAQSLEYATQGFMASQRMRANVLLASARGMRGDLSGALSGFEAVIADLGAAGSPYNRAEGELLRGLVTATHPDGDPEAALSDLSDARETFERVGARPAQARAERARGIALSRLQRGAEADEALSMAASMASEMGLLDGPWPATNTELVHAQQAASPIEFAE